MTGHEDFDRYQEEQATPQVVKAFEASRYFASFVVDPTSKETLFVGVWENQGKRPRPAGAPFGLRPNAAAVHFDLRRLKRFDGYRGRLVIDWGDGTRAWVQRADNQDKPIIELRQQARDPDFPGYLQFQRGLEELDALPPSWTAALHSNVGLKELGAAADAFDVAILEVASSDATTEAVYARESLWKTKLGSRVNGLNRN